MIIKILSNALILYGNDSYLKSTINPPKILSKPFFKENIFNIYEALYILLRSLLDGDKCLKGRILEELIFCGKR